MTRFLEVFLNINLLPWDFRYQLGGLLGKGGFASVYQVIVFVFKKILKILSVTYSWFISLSTDLCLDFNNVSTLARFNYTGDKEDRWVKGSCEDGGQGQAISLVLVFYIQKYYFDEKYLNRKIFILMSLFWSLVTDFRNVHFGWSFTWICVSRRGTLI